jgi:hypothetical protein
MSAGPTEGRRPLAPSASPSDGSTHEARSGSSQQDSSQQLRVERLDAFAALASGTTHELHNILASVIMGLDAVRQSCQNESALKVLAATEATSRRGLILTRQLQWLARGQELEELELQPKFLMSDLRNLVSAAFPLHLVITEYPPDLWLLRGDPLLVYQLLLALIFETWHGLGSRGTVILAAANHELHDPRGELQPGRWVSFEARAATGEAFAGEASAEVLFDQPFEPSETLLRATGAVRERQPDGSMRVYLSAPSIDSTSSP